MFGNPCKMSKIKSIAKKFKLKVIEDACLATGAEYENKKIGCLSDCSVFSTNPGKILDGIGPGGIITTNNKDLYNKLLQLRDYGRRERPKKWPVKSYIVGYNSKMSTINAAVLNIRLKKLNEYIDLRIVMLKFIKKFYFQKNKISTYFTGSKISLEKFYNKSKNRDKIFDKLNSQTP